LLVAAFWAAAFLARLFFAAVFLGADLSEEFFSLAMRRHVLLMI
jgi:hypothetical protein